MVLFYPLAPSLILLLPALCLEILFVGLVRGHSPFVV